MSVVSVRSWSLFAALACVPLITGCGGGEDGSSSSSSRSTSASSSSSKPADNSSTTKPSPDKPTPEPAEPTGGGYGTLTGKVTFDGTVPELPVLIMEGDSSVKDAAVCAMHTIPDQSLQVNADAGNGLANVFIYLPKAPKGAKESSNLEDVVFDQKNCSFVPHCLTIQSGQTIKVVSSDPVPHNVHTKPVRNQPLNSTIQPGDDTGIDLVYKTVERMPVEVICDIHSWMKAYHLPLDHSYMAVTDGNGEFEIPDLPAGTHEFYVWHERVGLLEKGYEVTIQPDGTTEMNLSYGAEKFANGARPPIKRVILSLVK